MDLPTKDLEITLNVLQQIAEHPNWIDSQEWFKSLISELPTPP